MSYALFDDTGRCLQIITSSLPFAEGAGQTIIAVAGGHRASDLWMQDDQIVVRQEWQGTISSPLVEGADISVAIPQGAWLRVLSADGMDAKIMPSPAGLAEWMADQAGAYIVEICGAASGTFRVDVKSFSTLRSEIWDRVKIKRSAVRVSDIDVPGIGPVQADMASRALIAAQADRAMEAPLGFSVGWTLADNSIRNCGLSDLQDIQNAIGWRDDACQQFSMTLRAAIENCAAAGALDEIDIEGGWPVSPGEA